MAKCYLIGRALQTTGLPSRLPAIRHLQSAIWTPPFANHCWQHYLQAAGQQAAANKADLHGLPLICALRRSESQMYVFHVSGAMSAAVAPCLTMNSVALQKFHA
jgi:hypothetical protein